MRKLWRTFMITSAISATAWASGCSSVSISSEHVNPDARETYEFLGLDKQSNILYITAQDYIKPNGTWREETSEQKLKEFIRTAIKEYLPAKDVEEHVNGIPLVAFFGDIGGKSMPIDASNGDQIHIAIDTPYGEISKDHTQYSALEEWKTKNKDEFRYMHAYVEELVHTYDRIHKITNHTRQEAEIYANAMVIAMMAKIKGYDETAIYLKYLQSKIFERILEARESKTDIAKNCEGFLYFMNASNNIILEIAKKNNYFKGWDADQLSTVCYRVMRESKVDQKEYLEIWEQVTPPFLKEKMLKNPDDRKQVVEKNREKINAWVLEQCASPDFKGLLPKAQELLRLQKQSIEWMTGSRAPAPAPSISSQAWALGQMQHRR